ncbi:HNH endonuclease signature motif containing protein [Isoptericola halotolerans]|uniref:HNH endonuclease signature motif containing protein n=1 Tax=Isoptericola halotolerans TaxID=300560 RepID=UPI00388D49AE
MVTSRTGTARWKRNRLRVLRGAKAAGVMHCPGYEGHACGRELDYRTRAEYARDEPARAGQYRANEAQVDHVREYRHGGTDDVENLRVLCADCQKRRNSERPTIKVESSADLWPLSRAW